MKNYFIASILILTSLSSFADTAKCDLAINSLYKNITYVSYTNITSQMLKTALARPVFSQSKTLQKNAASATQSVDKKVAKTIENNQNEVLMACNKTNMCASSIASLITATQDSAQASENAYLMGQMVKSLDKTDASRLAIIQGANQIKKDAAALSDSLFLEALSVCTSAPH